MRPKIRLPMSQNKGFPGFDTRHLVIQQSDSWPLYERKIALDRISRILEGTQGITKFVLVLSEVEKVHVNKRTISRDYSYAVFSQPEAWAVRVSGNLGASALFFFP